MPSAWQSQEANSQIAIPVQVGKRQLNSRIRQDSLEARVTD